MKYQTKKEKLIAIIKQEFGVVGNKADRVSNMIINVLEYKKRSNKENRYYWSVIIEMTAEYFGYTPQEMHAAWKDMFLKEERPGFPPKIRSTADESFKTIDAEKYYENIRRYMAIEHGFTIPLPRIKNE